MADFCKQCSIDNFGQDFKELAGITQQHEWATGKAAQTLCEGCGPIQVDPDGNCVSEDCLCKGLKGHGLPWIGETNESNSVEPQQPTGV